MRRFLLSLLILSLIVSGALFLQSRVSRTAEGLLSLTGQMEDALITGGIREAAALQKEFLIRWEDGQGWMYLLLPHAEMDDLEAATEYMSLSLKTGDTKGALLAISHIRADLRSIRDRDALSWDNLI